MSFNQIGMSDRLKASLFSLLFGSAWQETMPNQGSSVENLGNQFTTSSFFAGYFTLVYVSVQIVLPFTIPVSVHISGVLNSPRTIELASRGSELPL